ncbi:hypothetical protein [Bifidobacterium cuniculi]|uniref:Uncharacterized protein n=1 Tax=Bifidobacterium cuniculi TaxID=1688 RepID=A0A087B3X4_9BIFI|nr:hypothetical protein [Bifidobacterium cuniculi]KFI65724.1 hypothetical protein BCUN_0219 [Bifidobacterium cuniculi]
MDTPNNTTNTTNTTVNIDELVEQAAAKRAEELDWEDQWRKTVDDALHSFDTDMAEGKDRTDAATRFLQEYADKTYERMQAAARDTMNLIDKAAGNPFHTPDYKQRRADIIRQVEQAARQKRADREKLAKAEERAADSRETDSLLRHCLVSTLFDQALSWLTHADGDDLTITADRDNGFIYTGEVGIDLNAIVELLIRKELQ